MDHELSLGMLQRLVYRMGDGGGVAGFFGEFHSMRTGLLEEARHV